MLLQNIDKTKEHFNERLGVSNDRLIELVNGVVNIAHEMELNSRESDIIIELVKLCKTENEIALVLWKGKDVISDITTKRSFCQHKMLETILNSPNT